MKWWRNWHKWMGLVIGIQVLLWISGGVVMSVIPIDIVRGQHLRAEIAPPKAPKPKLMLDMQQWQSASWLWRGDSYVLQVTDNTGKKSYVAEDGTTQAAPLTEAQIKTLAQQAYAGQGQIEQINQLSLAPGEVSHLPVPLYQVKFNDWSNTSFYLSPDSGKLLSVRSDIWRLYDFFWMLHILDFEERKDFNNWLLIVAAVSAWLFVLTGFVLLYFSLLKPKWKKLSYSMK